MRPFILGVIPARGGSKGLRDKNIKRLKGVPLINYTIRAALKSRMLDDFVVSTDSEKIRDISRRCGAPVPFLRPHGLARDTSPSYAVARHAIKFYEKKFCKAVHSVVLLQPTTPLRTAEDIDNAVKGYLKNLDWHDSLISVCGAQQYHPQTLYKRRREYLEPWGKGLSHTRRRQELESILWRNGAIYISRRDVIFKKRNLLGKKTLYYQMPRWKSINIDDIHTFKMAEVMLQNKRRFHNNKNEEEI